jgi:D-alanyl-D-alanine carboxypeptidase
MATLGIALREHFPQYYGYFSTRSVVVAGKRLGNHNHLLGRVKGVDGIKTGYIRAAGFNLVTSVQDGKRSLVAVVMGGRTARTRDAHMVELIDKYMPKASTRDAGPLVAARKTIAPTEVVAAGTVVLPVSDIPIPDNRPTDSIVAYAGNAGAAPAAKAAQQAVGLVRAQPLPAVRPPLAISAPPAAETAQGDIDTGETGSTTISGWVIQVASVGSEPEAQALLARVREKAGTVLADARPFTEPFQKGDTLYVRARYGGFASKDEAWDACGALKRKDIACYAVEQ